MVFKLEVRSTPKPLLLENLPRNLWSLAWNLWKTQNLPRHLLWTTSGALRVGKRCSQQNSATSNKGIATRSDQGLLALLLGTKSYWEQERNMFLLASLLLVVRPGAPSSVRSLLVAMPGAPSSEHCY